MILVSFLSTASLGNLDLFSVFPFFFFFSFYFMGMHLGIKEGISGYKGSWISRDQNWAWPFLWWCYDGEAWGSYANVVFLDFPLFTKSFNVSCTTWVSSSWGVLRWKKMFLRLYGSLIISWWRRWWWWWWWWGEANLHIDLIPYYFRMGRVSISSFRLLLLTFL